MRRVTCPDSTTPEIALKSYVPTRSLATAVMAAGLIALVGMAVTLPLTRVPAPALAFAAMIVTGIGMLLRERVFAR